MDPVTSARGAREGLARGLALLQSPGLPASLSHVVEQVAQVMGLLHRIEATRGAAFGEAAPTALGITRRALGELQSLNLHYPEVDRALEAIASSLGTIHQLAQAAMGSQSTQASPQVAPPPPQAPGVSPYAGTMLDASRSPAPPAPQMALPLPNQAPSHHLPAPPPHHAPAPHAPAPGAYPPLPKANPSGQYGTQASEAYPAPAQAAYPAPHAPPPPAGYPAPHAPPPQAGYSAPPAQAGYPAPHAPPAQAPSAPYAAPPPAPSPGYPPAGYGPPPAANWEPPPQQPGWQQPPPGGQPPLGTAPTQQQPVWNGPSPAAPAPAAHAAQAPVAPHPPAQDWQQPPPSVLQRPPANVGPGAPVRIEASLGAYSPTNFYKGLAGNDVIDAGGLFVATYQIPPIGTQVMLKVALPGGYEFEAIGVVRWARETRDAESEAPPGFGAQIVQITPEARELVYRYVRNREPLFHDDN